MTRWVDDALQDVRHGLRIFRNSPAFIAVAVLTLGVAIGANTAIFSVIDAFLFRKLPVDRPDQLGWPVADPGACVSRNHDVL